MLSPFPRLAVCIGCWAGTVSHPVTRLAPGLLLCIVMFDRLDMLHAVLTKGLVKYINALVLRRIFKGPHADFYVLSLEEVSCTVLTCPLCLAPGLSATVGVTRTV